MRSNLLRVVVFLGLALSLHAEISLWCVTPAGEWEVIGCDKGRATIAKGDARTQAPEDAQFVVRGNVVDSPFSYLAPRTVSRRNEPGGKSPKEIPGRRMEFWIPRFNEPKGPFDFSAPWGELEGRSGILVFLWSEGTEQSRAAVRVFDGSKDLTIQGGGLSLSVPDESASGFPIVLFLEEGKWREPSKRFEKAELSPLVGMMAHDEISGLKKAVESDPSLLTARAGYDHATLLDLAIQMGRAKAVEALVQSGAKLSYRDKELSSPLRIATSMNRLEIVKWLLEHKADPNLEDEQNETALFEAVRVSNLKLVNLLLAGGAKADVENLVGMHPEHLVCETGSLEIYRILEAAHRSRDYKSSLSSRLLFKAIDLGYVPLAEYWISKGVRLRLDDLDIYPLTVAASNQDLPMLEMLYTKQEKDLKSRQVGLDRALEISVRKGSPEMTLRLLAMGAKGDQDKLMTAAAMSSQPTQIEALLGAGFRSKNDPSDGLSVLEAAILYSPRGPNSAIDKLLESGARLVPSRKRFGWALETALSEDRAAVLQSVLSSGVSPDYVLRPPWTIAAMVRGYRQPACNALLDKRGVTARMPFQIETSKTVDAPLKVLSSMPFNTDQISNEDVAPSVFTAEILVGPEGFPSLVRIVEEFPARVRSLLEETVRRWSFSKPTSRGNPVGLRVLIPITIPEEDVRVFNFNEVDRMCKPLKNQTAPRIPDSLRATRGLERVEVQYVVGKDGVVLSVEILRCSNLELAQSVETTVRRWKFDPALRHGKPVKVRVVQSIDFILANGY